MNFKDDLLVENKITGKILEAEQAIRYPTFQNGIEYKVGDRISVAGIDYICNTNFLSTGLFVTHINSFDPIKGAINTDSTITGNGVNVPYRVTIDSSQVPENGNLYFNERRVLETSNKVHATGFPSYTGATSTAFAIADGSTLVVTFDTTQDDTSIQLDINGTSGLVNRIMPDGSLRDLYWNNIIKDNSYIVVWNALHNCWILTNPTELPFPQIAGDVLTSDGKNWISQAPQISAPTTANNGLSSSGNNIELGGTLIKNTTLNGAFNLNIPTGKLGIGNTIPDAKLAVNGTTRLTGLSGGDNWLPYSDGMNYYRAINHVFADNGAVEKARLVGSSGYLGLGTNSPFAPLSIATGSTISNSLNFSKNEIKYRGDGVAHISIFGNRIPGTLTIENTGSDFTMGVTGTNIATFQVTGNVGIGTTSPAYRLDVHGDGGTGIAPAQGLFTRVNNTNSGAASTLYSVQGEVVGSIQGVKTAGGINGIGIGDTYLNAFNGASATAYTVLKGSTGNFGIGISPTEKLQVAGNIKFGGGGFNVISNAGTSSFGEIFSASDTFIGNYVKANGSASALVKTDPGLGSMMTMQLTDGIRFHTNLTGAVGTTVTRSTGEVMRIEHSGNVGIGLTPTSKLDVNGTTKTLGLQVVTGAGLGKVLTSDAAGIATWQTASGGGAVITASSGVTKTLDNITLGGSLLQDANLTGAFNLNLVNGNLGIGTTTPASKLDVLGVTRTNGLVVTSGGATGRVLTSDNLGTATWQPLPTFDFWRSGGGLVLPDGTTDTTDIVSRIGNVVIGTNTTTTHKLEVVDNVVQPQAMVSNGGNAALVPVIGVKHAGVRNAYLGIMPTSRNLFLCNYGSGVIDDTTVLAATAKASLVLTELGNVGIGTSTPSVKLEVNSTTAGISGVRLTQLAGAGSLATDALGNIVAGGSAVNTVTKSSGIATALADTFCTLGDLQFRYSSNAAAGTLEIRSNSLTPIVCLIYTLKKTAAAPVGTATVTSVAANINTGSFLPILIAGGLTANDSIEFELTTIGGIYNATLCLMGGTQVVLKVTK